jgi:predicted  nucleic acid-binding Zn-ribbon protein
MKLTKLEAENENNRKKFDELDKRLTDKEREYLSKRLTNEVYEDQLKKMIDAAKDTQDGVDNRVSIERFQHEIQQFTKELPKLKTQIDIIQARITFLKQARQELVSKRVENEKLDYDAQLALEEKILKENEYNRVVHARDTLRRIFRCRSTNDLPQKIFYALPVESKHSSNIDHGEYRMTCLLF